MVTKMSDRQYGKNLVPCLYNQVLMVKEGIFRVWTGSGL